MRFLFLNDSIIREKPDIYRTSILTQYRRNLEDFVINRGYHLSEMPDFSGAYLIHTDQVRREQNTFSK